MKQLIILSAVMLFTSITSVCQTVIKDTVMVDSSAVEEIKKMPMDTTHHNMPVAPLTRDSILNRRSYDDVDPKQKTPK